MLFALDARQFFSPCVYLDDRNENAFSGCFPRSAGVLRPRTKSDSLSQRIDCFIGLGGLDRGAEIDAAPQANGDGNAREAFSQAAYGISDHCQALASEVDNAERLYTVRIEARHPTD